MASNVLKLARKLVEELEKLEGMQEQGTQEVKNLPKLVQLSDLDPGKTFKLGDFTFVVLEQTPGQTAVISKGFIREAIVFDDNSTDYNNFSLKDLIETEIQPIIEKAVGADNLVEHEVDLTTVDMQRPYEKCKCKVRPITFDEARKYNDLLPNADLNDWW